MGRGEDFFLSGNGMRPPFLFLPAGEKETRISALRAALRAVALRNAAAAAGARCKEKEGWVADLLEPRFYFAAQVIRTSYELVQRRHMVRRRPRLRLCGAGVRYGACFLLCVVCLGVQGMDCGKLAPLCFSFRCCCAMRWGCYWLSISVGWLQSCIPKDRPNANAF